MYVQRNIEKLSFNHWCSGKAIGITYTECVFVTLGIQRTMRMRHFAICGLFPPTIFFHVISQTARYSEKKIIDHKTCVSIIYTNLCAMFLIRWDILINVETSSGTVLLILVRNWKFSYGYSTNTQIQNFIKICRVGSELFHADGRRDRHDETNSRFTAILLTLPKVPSILEYHILKLAHKGTWNIQNKCSKIASNFCL